MGTALAPIALFAYNRPNHLKKTLDSLAANFLAQDTDVIIFSDGPKKQSDEFLVGEVRNLIKNNFPFKSITIHEESTNIGLAQSIIRGVNNTVVKFGKVIVLEDDMVTSPFFLKYMNESLQKYQNVSEIISIHGYVYPLKSPMPNSFFLKGADCWGWATWDRGWKLFNSSAVDLYEQLKERDLLERFDFKSKGIYTNMLRDNIAGKNNSWAIRWYASALLADKLTLYPGTSLVLNIGLDNSGTNCKKDESYIGTISQEMPKLPEFPYIESAEGLKQFELFFGENKTFWSRIKRMIRNFI